MSKSFLPRTHAANSADSQINTGPAKTDPEAELKWLDYLAHPERANDPNVDYAADVQQYSRSNDVVLAKDNGFESFKQSGESALKGVDLSGEKVVESLIGEFANGNKTDWKTYGGHPVNVKDIAHGHSQLTLGAKIMQFLGHTPINGGTEIYAGESVNWRVYFPVKYSHGDLGVFRYGQIVDNYSKGTGMYYIRLRNLGDKFTLISLMFYGEKSYNQAKSLIGL